MFVLSKSSPKVLDSITVYPLSYNVIFCFNFAFCCDPPPPKKKYSWILPHSYQQKLHQEYLFASELS